MVTKRIQVVNPSGLHLRPAGMLCQTAMKFKSKIDILFENKEINAKSVLNVMVSGVKCGSDIEICCEGEDEKEALEAVCLLIQEGLKE